MKIVLLDAVMENEKIEMNKQYEVVRTETVRDDLYYIVINVDGKEVGVHELLAVEI